MSPHTLRRALLMLLLLPVGPAARAATSPPGVNLRWDNCFADAGVQNKTFACDTNAGSEELVLSFELDTPMADVSGQEIIVDLRPASPTIPAWWEFRNAGTCRTTALSLNLVPPPTAVNCADWGNGQQGGGIANYIVNVSGYSPNTNRILAAVGVPGDPLASLSAGQEYFTASIRINHSKTVGTGSCGGCDVPVCLVYESLNLTTPVPGDNRRLLHGANGQGSQIAHWQNAQATNVAFSCGRTPCYTWFDCVLADPTRSRGSTWGAVKSLYR